MRRRADIQGLRAVAVLLVALGHAGVSFLRGGFVGVDVFFVLSGFLITGLLLAEAKAHGSVSLTDFYARRARRILPAAVLTLIATDVAAHHLLNFVRARQVGLDSLWASAFLANIHFAGEGTDYFARVQPPSPLLHFWTLSVEEQFYLAWPALLSLILFGVAAVGGRCRRPVGRPQRARLLLAVVLLAGGSLAWSVQMTATTPAAAYFSPLARAWELGLGAALAIASPSLARLPAVKSVVIGWTGLLAIGLSATLYSEHTRFPGWLALLPTIGTALVIIAGIGDSEPRLAAGRLLTLRPMRYVGDRSYAFYLWHWPVLTIAALYAGHQLPLTERLLLLVAAFALSVTSYRLVENPIRRGRFPERVCVLLWPVSAAALLVVALAILRSTGATAAQFRRASAALHVSPLVDPAAAATVRATSPKPLPAVLAAVHAAEQGAPLPSPLTPPIGSLHSDFYFFPTGCAPAGHATSSNICRLGRPASRKTIAVMGDSHAEMWMPTILAMAQQDGWAIIPFVKTGCIPRTWPSSGECGTWYRWARHHAQALRPDVTLIIGSRAGTRDPLEEVAPTIALNKSMKPYSASVIDVSDPPNQTQDPTDCLLNPGATMKTCTTRSKPAQLQAEAAVAAADRREGTGFINVFPWLCGPASTSRGNYLCPMVVNHTITNIDRQGHISKTYALELAPSFRAAFRRELFR